jgi:branched-chain amino acid transport system permease protein
MQTKMNWTVILRYGLIGGVVALYFSMIGMVEAFSLRNLVGTILNLGNILLFGGMLAAGYMAVRQHEGAPFAKKALAGLLAGAVAALVPILLIVGDQNLALRPIFVNVTPAIIRTLTFGREGAAGFLILTLVSAGVGLLAALYHSLPPRFRSPIGKAIAWTLILAIFSELVIQILRNLSATALSSLLFTGNSFKPTAAIGLLILLTALFFFQDWRHTRHLSADPVSTEKTKRARLRTRVIQFILLGAFLLAAPYIVGSFLSQVLFEIGRYVLLGLGLNIVVGYAGLLDLGYVAFFAFGAYTMAILTTTTALNPSPGVFNFWLALPIAVVVGVLFGLILGFPVLRMRGDYLAIVTLGFGEIIRILALSDWLAPIMGGAQGVLSIPVPSLFGIDFRGPERMYYLVLFGSLLAAFISVRLRDSRLGRQWMAMREDEDVAEAMGINLVQTKLLAFAIGAGFSALGGAIFAARLNTIFPHSFNLLISVNALSLIIVGGMGSIPGVIVGAIALVGLPELLRQFQEYRLLMYGIVLIVMMLVRPEGFLPTDIIKRELHRSDAPDQPNVEIQA